MQPIPSQFNQDESLIKSPLDFSFKTLFTLEGANYHLRVHDVCFILVRGTFSFHLCHCMTEKNIFLHEVLHCSFQLVVLSTHCCLLLKRIKLFNMVINSISHLTYENQQVNAHYLCCPCIFLRVQLSGRSKESPVPSSRVGRLLNYSGMIIYFCLFSFSQELKQIKSLR